MANGRDYGIDEQDRREMLPVPRHEVRAMIAQFVKEGIASYDQNIAMPRHLELKLCVEKSNTGISNMEKTMTRVEGGIDVLKWLGSAAFIVIGAGGGVLAWARFIHR